MKLFMRAAALVAAFVAGGFAIAQEFRPLAGRYALPSANIVDPVPGEKPDRVALFIEGRAAEEMYQGMLQKPARDQCAGDATSKKAGTWCVPSSIRASSSARSA